MNAGSTPSATRAASSTCASILSPSCSSSSTLKWHLSCFPWAVSLSRIGLLGFWSMMGFLFVLTIGFIYEWKKGALEWE